MGVLLKHGRELNSKMGQNGTLVWAQSRIALTVRVLEGEASCCGVNLAIPGFGFAVFVFGLFFLPG